ncbi:hypothetical protein A6V39_00610 [Candidatus Mycoplasma haematobovis]|uniref:Uncharacterized protein n=1 Tax=Candidatus Mycoplasma haematobovis TaxID=432608 RepID=A0A1A9QD86_9MOLU|nr:hypothetical protein [Candidatus Mycoplasma haematobovis]OAL10552.1 hypothetical protein A6V39_00610 [Candidatus Mycoplasma haematobovis]
MNQANRALALVSAFGAVGGVGAYASGLFGNKPDKPKAQEIQEKPKPNINNRLTEEGFKVLGTTSEYNNDWNDVLVEYRKATVKSFTKEQEREKTREQLQEDCTKTLQETSETESSYKLAKQWCVKKESINIILGRAKRKLLKLDAPEDPAEKQHWTDKVAELKKNKTKFDAIKDRIKETETTEGENITVLKEGCKNLKMESTETTSDEFENNFPLAKEWCSVESNIK